MHLLSQGHPGGSAAWIRQFLLWKGGNRQPALSEGAWLRKAAPVCQVWLEMDVLPFERIEQQCEVLLREDSLCSLCICSVVLWEEGAFLFLQLMGYQCS